MIKNKIQKSDLFKKSISPLFGLLVLTSTVCMLLSNTVANKQFDFFGIGTLPAGTLVFPITYILSDVFSEVYGYKWSRRTAWLGFMFNLFMVLVYQLTIWIPGPVWFEGQAAYETVLGSAPRLLIASLTAYMVGDFVNDVVFKKMKKDDKVGKGFGIRAIVSSFCGELVDSCVFIPCAFLFNAEAGFPTLESALAAFPMMILLQVIIKVGYEIIILPVTHLVVKGVRKYENKFEKEKEITQ